MCWKKFKTLFLLDEWSRNSEFLRTIWYCERGENNHWQNWCFQRVSRTWIAVLSCGLCGCNSVIDGMSSYLATQLTCLSLNASCGFLLWGINTEICKSRMPLSLYNLTKNSLIFFSDFSQSVKGKEGYCHLTSGNKAWNFCDAYAESSFIWLSWWLD